MLTPKQAQLVHRIVFEVANELGLCTDESLAPIRQAAIRAVTAK